MKFLNKRILFVLAIWGGLYYVWNSDFLTEPDAIYEDDFEEVSDGRPPAPPPSRPSRPEDRPPLPPGHKPKQASKPIPVPQPEPVANLEEAPPAPAPTNAVQPVAPTVAAPTINTAQVDPNLPKPSQSRVDPNARPRRIDPNLKARSSAPAPKKRIDPNLKPRQPTSVPTVVKAPANVVVSKPTTAAQRSALPMVRNRTYRIKKNCGMREAPSKSSRLVGNVKKNKKLWVEKSKPGWGKVFRKAGPAYIEHDCVL